MPHNSRHSIANAGVSSRTAAQLTVLVPAFNESTTLADTIESLRVQTVLPAEIIVIDDCSTDATGDVARALGVTVLRPPTNTGSKAGAQNFALRWVRTPFVMAIDADTTLAPDAIERLLEPFADPGCAAACGFVIPRHVRTVWERGGLALPLRLTRSSLVASLMEATSSLECE